MGSSSPVTPKADERLFAYRLEASQCARTSTSAERGAAGTGGDYRFVQPQPTDAD
jgi:hypothetical protein